MESISSAKRVIERCKTRNGFFASVDIYKDLWLRDLVYSESILIKLGYQETVRQHLETFLKYQLKSGEIPSVILEGWMRFLGEMYHYWTADSEILFVLGMIKYAEMTHDYTFLEKDKISIERCVESIRRKLNSLGLVPGLDWRDAIINYFHGKKYLLSNQVLLAQMYEKLGITECANSLKETIRSIYFSQRSESESLLPVDCIFWDGNQRREENVNEAKFEYRLDCLGNSLAILFEIVTGNDAMEVSRNIELARTEYGYRNLVPPIQIERMQSFSSRKKMNAFVKNGAFLRNRPEHYQNSTVWPFVEARIVSAFRKIEGFQQKAEELSKIIIGRKGFGEWYSPIDGLAHGSKGQLWTAAAVLDQYP